MRLSLTLGSVVLALCVGRADVARAGAKPAIAASERDPQPIFGGEAVAACAWPTAVGVVSSSSRCTGTLVHPRVVMFAAHCGANKPQILFGEDISAPAKTVATELCMTNPDYKGPTDQEHDWAFCRLAEPVTDIPITPIAFGCETSTVASGIMAAITGFGVQEEKGESGRKNWAMTPVRQIYSMSVDLGGLGDPGICPGDSGGPAFVRYADNSWHVFGIASTVTGSCGGIGTHSLAWHAVPWIEAESGIDITPCHDQDGTWNPSFRCTDFYAAEPGEGFGQFEEWCPATPRNLASVTCGAAFDAVPDETPPTVQLVMPLAGSYPDLKVLETALVVDAEDGEGWGIKAVRIKINGAEQAVVDDEFPYEFATVKFPTGTWEIVAVAEDAAGLLAESAPVLVHVGMVASEDTGEAPTTGDATSEVGSDISESDISETAIASDTADMDADGGGCGCRSQPAGASGWLLLLALAGRRRRDSW